MTDLSSTWTHLQHIADLERQSEAQQDLEHLRLRSFQEREASGQTLARCVLLEREENLKGTRLLFRLPIPEDEPVTVLDKGDQVCLEGGHKDSLSPDLSGRIIRREDNTAWIQFKHKLPEEIHSGKWHLSRIAHEATWLRIERALKAWSSTTNSESLHLAKVLSGQKSRSQTPETISKWHTPHLNPSQQAVIQEVMGQKEIGLVWGPPGTGKTVVLAEIIYQAVSQGLRVLLSAPSNLAVDTLCGRVHQMGIPCLRIGSTAKIFPEIKPLTLAAKWHDHPQYPIWKDIQQERAKIMEAYPKRKVRGYLKKAVIQKFHRSLRDLSREARTIRNRSIAHMLRHTPVLACTHAGYPEDLPDPGPLDWIILDESSQALPPLSWVPLLRGKKVVLAGDPCQLPPVYFAPQHQSQEPATLMANLLKRYPEKCQLNQQYRMNAVLQDFSAHTFYSDQLIPAHPNQYQSLDPLGLTEEPLVGSGPIAFIDTAGTDFDEETPKGSDSLRNPEEARLLLKFATHYLQAGLPPESLGIISPYKSQVSLLRSLSPKNLDIHTIDGFQGREKDILLISLVRSNRDGKVGFLEDERRLNVAFTRARYQMVVIGNSATLNQVPLLNQWMDWIEAQNAHQSAWQWIE